MGNKNFCVFRVEKIKSGAGVKAQLSEMLPDEITDENGKTEIIRRTSERADKERSDKNTNSGMVTESFENYRSFLPAKVRKNAVVGLSFVVSTSQEFGDRETEEKYYEDSRKFISEHFGKVVAWSIHRDETSTHMQVITVPLDENNKLNAKKLIGGSSRRLATIQSNFHKDVGKKYGLERGEQNSKKKHQTVEEFHKLERAEIEKQKKELAEKEAELKKEQIKIKRQEKENQNIRDGLDSLKEYYKQEKENQERNLKEREEALIRRESDFNSRYNFFENSKNLWSNVEKGLNDDFENFEKTPSKSGFKKLKENCMNLYKRVKNLFLDVKERLTKYEDKPLEEVIENFQKAQKKGFKTYGEYLKNQFNSNSNPNSNIQKKSKLGRS